MNHKKNCKKNYEIDKRSTRKNGLHNVKKAGVLTLSAVLIAEQCVVASCAETTGLSTTSEVSATSKLSTTSEASATSKLSTTSETSTSSEATTTNTAPLSSDTSSTEKEEVIYAMLSGDGTVQNVYAVNSFTQQHITDYGTYTSIRNLTSTDPINLNNDTITITTGQDKLYYQGNLATKDIPWNIEIHYYLDDKEYTPADIAGKYGKLRMAIDITQNTNCTDSFWNGYSLQATVSLDTKLCKNITAEGATIANVGSNKQLSYIILPGKGASLEVTADVKDFRMDAISLNGTKLNLNFQLDSQELTDKIEELQNAVNDLNNGAGDLNTGAAQLENGAKELYDGTVTLNNAASILQDGTTQLNSGIKTMQEALTALDGKSSYLTSGSREVLTALQTIQSSLE